MVDIQSAATEIRRGKKIEERKKPQGKNIMVCPIPYGDHKKWPLALSTNVVVKGVCKSRSVGY